MPDLIKHLLSEPYKYSLFQSISLLERYLDIIKPTQQERGEFGIELKAHVSLAFPSSDVYTIRQDPIQNSNFKLYTPLICLAGSTGPIPKVFTELFLTSQKNKDEGPLDFLDIFNHRLIHLFYNQKQKYHLALGKKKINALPILKFVNSLSSLDQDYTSNISPPYSVWLSHAALQGPAPRSIEGLKSILFERVGIKFESEQFIGDWISLDEFDHATLGAHYGNGKLTKLGENSTLGKRFWDQSAAFLFKAFNLSMDSFSTLLPWNKKHLEIKWLIDRHQTSPRRVCLELHMDVKKYIPMALGRKNSPLLGLTSWLVGSIKISKSKNHNDLVLTPCRFWLKN